MKKIINYLIAVSLTILILCPPVISKAAEEAFETGTSILDVPIMEPGEIPVQTSDYPTDENVLLPGTENIDELNGSNATVDTISIDIDNNESPITDPDMAPEQSADDQESIIAETDVSETVMELVYARTELIDLPPVINLLGPATVAVNLGETYVDPGAQAFDDMDGDLSSQINIFTQLDESIVGVYDIQYSVSDSAGNIAEIVRTVEVMEPLIVEPEIVEESGRIYDAASDSGIAGVEMHFYNIASEEEYITFTNRQGYYSVYLPAGNYQVTLIRNLYNTCVYDVAVGIER